MSDTTSSHEERLAAAFHAFHDAACARLGIDRGRVSAALVPAALGVHRVQYAEMLSGRGASLDLLARWAETIGLELFIPPRGPIVVRAPAEPQR